MKFLVSVPDGLVSKTEFREYIRSAIQTHRGAYHPDDALFDLQGHQVKVSFVKDKEKLLIKCCDKCGCEVLSPLRSISKKKCTSCGHEMDWFLDPGQQPLVRNNRL